MIAGHERICRCPQILVDLLFHIRLPSDDRGWGSGGMRWRRHNRDGRDRQSGGNRSDEEAAWVGSERSGVSHNQFPSWSNGVPRWGLTACRLLCIDRANSLKARKSAFLMHEWAHQAIFILLFISISC
jgi:hypothetical protein